MSKLEQAFVTLEELSTRWPQIMDAVVALREALAQPVIDKSAATRIATSLGWEPKRKPLTPDQVFAIADQHPVEGFDPEIMAFARAIEAAHGIKE